MTHKTTTFLDLFSGLGGTRIGFEQAGQELGIDTKCVFSSDIKEASKKAHHINFPGENLYGDITKIDIDDIPDCDYILAGFPCQPFSKAGSRRGFSDTRGTLFFNIEKITKVKRPQGLLLENVENFARHDKGNTLKVVVNVLENLGYNVSYKVIDASVYGGVPQARKRIYIVADKDKSINLDKIPQLPKATFASIREHNLACVHNDFTDKLIDNIGRDKIAGKQIIDKRGGTNVIHSWDFDMLGKTTPEQRNLLNLIRQNQRKRHFADELGIRWRDGMPLNINQIKSFDDYFNLEKDLEYLVNCGYLIKQHPYYDDSLEQRYDLPIGYKLLTGRLKYPFNRILGDDDICVTLTATDAKKIGCVDTDGIRGLSQRECLRFFGFPEWYSLSGLNMNDVYDLVGNSIVVPVVKNITKLMLKTV